MKYLETYTLFERVSEETKLFESIKNLEKDNESLNKAKTQTFKDHLVTTQIEIKTFTDNSGKKVTFDVLGYEQLAKDVKRESISL